MSERKKQVIRLDEVRGQIKRSSTTFVEVLVADTDIEQGENLALHPLSLALNRHLDLRYYHVEAAMGYGLCVHYNGDPYQYGVVFEVKGRPDVTQTLRQWEYEGIIPMRKFCLEIPSCVLRQSCHLPDDDEGQEQLNF